ncbi:unnamed protein product, partial [Vitis vinifera]
MQLMMSFRGKEENKKDQGIRSLEMPTFSEDVVMKNDQYWWVVKNRRSKIKTTMEMRGIDPRTSRMLSERSTI